MLRSILLILLTFTLMVSQAFAHVIKLSPKESKSLTNHYAWTVNATCNIQGAVTKGNLLVSVVENKGKINGKNLSKGQATSIRLHDHSSISVSAEPGTTVNLVNQGNDPVEADCLI